MPAMPHISEEASLLGEEPAAAADGKEMRQMKKLTRAYGMVTGLKLEITPEQKLVSPPPCSSCWSWCWSTFSTDAGAEAGAGARAAAGAAAGARVRAPALASTR